jgi:hypothetical protein
MAIYIFYHIFCNENTFDILKDQTNKIIFSGLYTTVDKIYCFLTGEHKYIYTCRDYIYTLGNKFIIAAEGINDSTYERFTLLKIREYIKSGDKFLYIHTKGCTKPHSTQVYYWRTYMEYFLMTLHKQCIEDLNNYDIAGIILRRNPRLHFSGNFWWATANYYLKLPHHIDDDYLSPEFYIGTLSPNTKVYSDTDKDGYSDNIIIKDYIDN